MEGTIAEAADEHHAEVAAVEKLLLGLQPVDEKGKKREHADLVDLKTKRLRPALK